MKRMATRQRGAVARRDFGRTETGQVLAGLLQKTSDFVNDWAASDLVVALAAAAAPLGDEDLLNAVLTWTSEQRAKPWCAVAAVATARSRTWAWRAGAGGIADPPRARGGRPRAVWNEERERRTYEAETVTSLALLGRHDEAAAVLDRVIEAALEAPAGYYRDRILSPLESALDDLGTLPHSRSWHPPSFQNRHALRWLRRCRWLASGAPARRPAFSTAWRRVPQRPTRPTAPASSFSARRRWRC